MTSACQLICSQSSTRKSMGDIILPIFWWPVPVSRSFLKAQWGRSRFISFSKYLEDQCQSADLFSNPNEGKPGWYHSLNMLMTSVCQQIFSQRSMRKSRADNLEISWWPVPVSRSVVKAKWGKAWLITFSKYLDDLWLVADLSSALTLTAQSRLADIIQYICCDVRSGKTNT